MNEKRRKERKLFTTEIIENKRKKRKCLEHELHVSHELKNSVIG